MRRTGSCALWLAGLLASQSANPAPPDTARLSLGPALGDLPRIGVNLGGRSVWGAEQLMANVLQNPGLESGQDGALLIVGRITADGVEDDTPWTARPAGFWAGARYEVLSGAAAGQRGLVAENRRVQPDRPDSLLLSPTPRGLRPGDVITLQGQQDPRPVPLWWTEGLVRSVAEPRPGSPGQRSLRLQAASGRPAALYHHLDSITGRAGKLLPVQGRWRLSFWVKGTSNGPNPTTVLKVSFGRQGRPAWLHRDIRPGTDWRQETLEFDTRDDGPAGPLMLSLALEQGAVLLDDLWLGRADAASPGGFRPEVVATLQQLRPGYLRDWQGQLADTPANRLAPDAARHPIRYRPGADDWIDAYSLPDFLALCAAVSARPWVILPSTSSPDDARQLGQALAQAWQQYRFDEIVVEHGNEHWNGIFRPAGISNPATLAEVADRAFAALREGAGPQVRLHRVLGAQFVNPAVTERLSRLTHQVDNLAIAPYFHFRQDGGTDLTAALDQALADSLQPLRALLNQHVAPPDVYEVNFHTLGGSASVAERQAVLLAPEAGTVLLQRLLQAAQVGVKRQVVYSLAGFDSTPDRPAPGSAPGGIPLFGITRDLTATGQWRPTGQAVVALNRLMGGPVHAALCQGSACGSVTALGFAQGSRWVVSSAAAQATELQWPCQMPQRVRTHLGEAADVACQQGSARRMLAARGWLTAEPLRPASDR